MKGYEWGERTTLISLYLAQLSTKHQNCTLGRQVTSLWQCDSHHCTGASEACAFANWHNGHAYTHTHTHCLTITAPNKRENKGDWQQQHIHLQLGEWEKLWVANLLALHSIHTGTSSRSTATFNSSHYICMHTRHKYWWYRVMAHHFRWLSDKLETHCYVTKGWKGGRVHQRGYNIPVYSKVSF